MPLGSLIGGMISAGGASSAGQTAANAGNIASQSLINAGNAAAQGAYQNANLYLPWNEPGYEAYARLAALGRGDATAQGNALATAQGMPGYQLAQPYVANYKAERGGELNRAFQSLGLGGFETSPGYQFRLDQGRNALANSASARGMTMSGAQAKALTDYNQGAASQEYQNWVNNYNNWLAQHGSFSDNLASLGTNLGRTAQGDYTQLLGRLSEMGWTAADRGIQTNMAGNDYSFRGYQSGMPAYQQGQNALASSQAASANAIGQGISNGMSNLATVASFGLGQGWLGGGGSGANWMAQNPDAWRAKPAGGAGWP